jgi:Flp pilus assembly protein CpaB
MASVRAVRVQRPAWANLRTSLGLLLFCVALIWGQRVITGAQETVRVWVAARDLPADSVLAEGDLRLEEVRLPDELLGSYVGAGTEVEGRWLARPVMTGEMVAHSSVLDAADESGGRTMTLTAEALGQSAAGIQLGDRVDVIATFDAGDARSKTVPVVRNAEVARVVTTSGFGEGSEVAGLTIEVPDELVGMLAFARHNAALDVVEVDGGSATEQGWSVTRDDF